MIDPFVILIAVLLGAAIAGSPVAMKVVRSRFTEDDSDSTKK